MKPNVTPDTGQMAEELALLGHDIRSAITDVMAGLSLVDTQGLDAISRLQLDRARATTEALIRYLERGLTTLLAQAPPKVETSLTDLANLLQDLKRRWGHSTESLVITTTDLPAMLDCDRTAIDRILSNLIGNAIAYSNGQTVYLAVTQPEPHSLRFTITDQGPGFPPDLDKAPVANSALPAWETREGHGLGLGIAKTLARRIGASLSLQNNPSGGGVATVSLPLGSVPAPQLRPAETVNCLNGKHVLIADDSMPQLLLLSRFLSESGAQVTMVRDGTAAQAALLAGAFDLALIDLEMPGQTGLDICKAFRNKPPSHGKTTRLVILTAHPMATIQQTALAAGADHVISKPITTAQSLTDALCNEVARPAKKAASRSKPKSDAFEKLLEMAGPDLAPELLARYREDLLSVQSRLIAGFQDVDWKSLSSASHVLISLAGTAGYRRLEQASRNLNSAAHGNDQSAVLAQKETVLNGLTELLSDMANIAQERKF